MVISPLLFPVICAGAATYRADWSAFFRAVVTFAVGFLAAVAAAVAVGLFYATTFRSEIIDRLSGAIGDYVLVAFFSGAQSFPACRSIFGNPCDVETDLRQTGNAEFACGNLRHIDYSSFDERATIGDAHHRRAPVILIIDTDQRPEWQ